MSEKPSQFSLTHEINHEIMARVRDFFRLESAGGMVLVAAAVVAMIFANSGLDEFYEYILHNVDFTIGFLSKDGSFDLALNKSILHWVNDGLMTIFFFLVGLEIKREMKEGELSTRDRALLPFIAAIGGMIVPALIFYFFNESNAHHLRGWAIPSATDIAFTLGVLALLGSRVPLSLKILAMAIAVIDDLGAILIIAVFYTGDILWSAVWVAFVALAVLIWMNKTDVVRPAAYILVGFILWLAVLKSGVHATLAGVVVAFCLPMKNKNNPTDMPVKDMIHMLHPWVAFMVLPIFSFANAGVPIHGLSWSTMTDPVVAGIALGLFLGKQIGIFLALVLAIVFKISPKPVGTTWLQLYGMAILCGIGFTMSLFIGGLAYEGPVMQAQVRLGVLGGSLVSAILGYLVLRYLARPAH